MSFDATLQIKVVVTWGGDMQSPQGRDRVEALGKGASSHLPTSWGVWGSVFSSPNGDPDAAPSQIDFYALFGSEMVTGSDNSH